MKILQLNKSRLFGHCMDGSYCRVARSPTGHGAAPQQAENFEQASMTCSLILKAEIPILCLLFKVPKFSKSYISVSGVESFISQSQGSSGSMV